MGWEKRKYYTRSVKINGRVVREYYGKGYFAKLVAELHDLERQQRSCATGVYVFARLDLRAMEEAMKRISEDGALVGRALLLAAGYHQHKGGEWRKRREPRNSAKS